MFKVGDKVKSKSDGTIMVINNTLICCVGYDEANDRMFLTGEDDLELYVDPQETIKKLQNKLDKIEDLLK